VSETFEQCNDCTLGLAGEAIDVVLVGGPPDLPLAQRVRQVAQLVDKIKVEHRGGYEHFVRREGTGRDGASSSATHRPNPWVVYEWDSRTRIAE
jgi:hypothetical protein